MDKQKQIEEMIITVYPIYATMEDSLRKEAIECMNSYMVFEKLYNAGYRKIPENAVVLTREEFSEKIENTWLNCQEFTRKETAEKFAERLKEVGRYYGNAYVIDKRTVTVSRIIEDLQIDYICKELTEGNNGK